MKLCLYTGVHKKGRAKSKFFFAILAPILGNPSYENKRKQAGAELGQAQVKLDDIVVVVVEVVVKAMVEVEVQLLFRVGGGWVVG